MRRSGVLTGFSLLIGLLGVVPSRVLAQHAPGEEGQP